MKQPQEPITDNWLKETFEQYAEMPSEKVWLGIENDLQPTPKKFFIGTEYTIAASLIVILAVGVLFKNNMFLYNTNYAVPQNMAISASKNHTSPIASAILRAVVPTQSFAAMPISKNKAKNILKVSIKPAEPVVEVKPTIENFSSTAYNNGTQRIAKEKQENPDKAPIYTNYEALAEGTPEIIFSKNSPIAIAPEPNKFNAILTRVTDRFDLPQGKLVTVQKRENKKEIILNFSTKKSN